MSERTQDKSVLAKIAVIAGILAAIASIAGVAWTIFHRESTDVADYQSQVSATCEQINKILAAEHNEIFDFTNDGGGADSPDDLIRVRKDVMLQVMEDNLAQAKNAFAALNEHEVPGDLTTAHQSAVKAQDAWYTAIERGMSEIRERLPAKARLADVQKYNTGDRGANVRLNSAMTALAGKNCQVTA